jgi:hypothetical protein
MSSLSKPADKLRRVGLACMVISVNSRLAASNELSVSPNAVSLIRPR